MCDFGLTAMVATAASAIVGAYGAIAGGQAQKAQADYQAEVARQNIERAKQDRPKVVERSETEQFRLAERYNQVAGDTEAKFAAMGLDVNAGTPSDLLKGARNAYDIDRSILAKNEKEELYANLLEQYGYQNEATLARFRGQSAERAGWLEGAGTLLNGAGRVANQWDGYNRRSA